jgi:acyl-CoA synthetase (AMP-forming)/AMP-acid ligase II
MQPTTVIDLLPESDRPALIDCEGGWTLSHRELREVVDELALGLRAAGVAPGDGVGVVMANRASVVAAFLAIVRLGAVAMPVNPQLRRGEIEAIFADWPTRAVLVGPDGHAEGRAAAEGAGTPVYVIGDEHRPVLEGFGRGTGELPAVDPDAVALLLHTSGTTSRPKAVPLRQRNLAASARAIAAGYGLGADDRSYCLMPLFHIHGLVASTLSALSAEGCVVVPRSVRAGALWPHVREHGISWFSAVPTILAKLPQAPNGGPGTLRFARSCSSALPPQLWNELEERFGVPLVEAYGMTEASHQMATNRLPPGDRRAGSVGVGTGTEIRILDAEWNALPAGEAGEVAVRGPGVVNGYLANPEANASSFRGGWFRTGDLGRLSGDGHLTLEGRLKELINRGGEKIAPREIDEVLLDHPGVTEAVAYGVADAKWGEVVHAAVVASGGVNPAALRAFCGERLAPFKVPRRIHVVDAIPKGPTGKVQRTTLGAALDA